MKIIKTNKGVEKTSENNNLIAKSSPQKKTGKASSSNQESTYAVFALKRIVNSGARLYTAIFKMKNPGISQEWWNFHFVQSVSQTLATTSRTLPTTVVSGKLSAKSRVKKKVLNWLKKPTPINASSILWKTKNQQSSSNIYP